jgi:hypothetical protein
MTAPATLQATHNLSWCVPNNIYETWISVCYFVLFYYDFNFVFVLWPFIFLSATLQSLIVSHWYFVALRFGHINIQAPGIIILWNQVTFKTFLPARYCTLFKVWDCCMNEVMGCMNDQSRLECLAHPVPILLHSVLSPLILHKLRILDC